MGKVVAAVRRHAPGKLAYINLFPSHNGVYYSGPLPAAELPTLPGNLIRRCAVDLLEAIADPEAPLPAVPPPSLKIRNAPEPAPVMVGEFRGADGAGYALVVNLSLERTAKVVLEAVCGTLPTDSFSAEESVRVW